MKKIVRYIVVGIVVLLVSGFVIADTLNQEKQVLVDGDMEDTGVVTDIWTAGNSATLSKQTGGAEDGSQVLRIYKNGAYGQAMQNELTDGKTYRVTGWARGGDTGYPRINLHTVVVWTGDPANTWQYFDVTGTADGVSFVLYKIGDSDSYAEYDDLLVTELTPPIVNNEATLADFADGDMEEDGTDIPFIKKFDLTQAANITADSGVITGDVTPYSCAGATFDGTNDYVTYTIPSTLFSTSPSISIVVEFTPDFAYDENANRYLFDTTNLHRYLAYKANNAANNTITLYLGHQLIAGIPSATYSAYWLQDARNVLVISSNGTLTNAWLNGTQILTNDVTAWTVKSPTELAVGASAAGVTRFDGEIHAVSIYSGLLDGTDALNLYNSVDTSDWTTTTNTCLTKQLGVAESGSQVLRVAYTDTANPAAKQNILGTGKTYRITGWARGDGTAVPKIIREGGASIWEEGTSSTDWQYFDAVFTATVAGNVFLQTIIAGAGHAEFDDVLLTEYTPPMVNDYDQELADGDMELETFADWTVFLGTTISKGTGGAEDGVRVLRLTGSAADGIFQALVCTAGQKYRVTGWARGDAGTGVPTINYAGSGAAFWTGTNSITWQYFDEIFTADHSSFLVRTVGDGWVEFDDVMVTETVE